MICNRCANELPSDTPVCRVCGPVTLDPGFAPPPPLPPISFAPASVTPLAPPVSGAPVSHRVEPLATTVVPPPPRPERQSKAQRRRAALASRAASVPDTEPLAADTFDTPMAELARPRPVTLIARLDLAVGAAHLLVGWGMQAGRVPAQGVSVLGLNPGAAFFVSGLAMLIAATGLFQRKPFGRYAQLAIVGAGLMWGSWANVIGIPIAVYLMRPGVQLLFSGRDASSLEPQECRRIRKDTPSPILVPIAVTLEGLVAAVRLLPLIFAVLAG